MFIKGHSWFSMSESLNKRLYFIIFYSHWHTHTVHYVFISLYQSVKGVLVHQQGLWPGLKGFVGLGPRVLLWEAGICLPSKPFTTSCSTRSLTKILLVLFKNQTATKYIPHHRTTGWIAESFPVWPSCHLKAVLKLNYGLEVMFGNTWG